MFSKVRILDQRGLAHLVLVKVVTGVDPFIQVCQIQAVNTQTLLFHHDW